MSNPGDAIATAILIAASSNNLVQTGYAVAFAGGRAAVPSAVAFAVLALAGIAIAVVD